MNVKKESWMDIAKYLFKNKLKWLLLFAVLGIIAVRINCNLKTKWIDVEMRNLDKEIIQKK